MTRDDINKMARECGLMMRDEPMHGVAHLVRLAYERGRLDENEACARVCEEGGRDESGRIHVQAWGAAKAIRARRTSTVSPATLIDPRGSLGEPIV